MFVNQTFDERYAEWSAAEAVVLVASETPGIAATNCPFCVKRRPRNIGCFGRSPMRLPG